jgi:hypothetical protein
MQEIKRGGINRPQNKNISGTNNNKNHTAALQKELKQVTELKNAYEVAMSSFGYFEDQADARVLWRLNEINRYQRLIKADRIRSKRARKQKLEYRGLLAVALKRKWEIEVQLNPKGGTNYG